MHKINLDEFEKVIYLKDTYFPYTYINHDRYIVRGIIVDKDNKIALHNVVRNDQFGDASYYETPGGGVKNNEDFISALKREIKEELDFPDYYGCNWSAFWDCLTDMYGDPIHIEIIGLEVIERKFGDSAEKMIEILRRFKHFNNDLFSDSIKIEIVSGNTRVSLR